MLGSIAIGLAVVGVSALVTSFILDELTEDEKQKQQEMYNSFENYKNKKESELKEILNRYKVTEEELFISNNAEIIKVRDSYLNKYQVETERFIEYIERIVEEQLELNKQIKDEIKVGIDRIKRMRNNQTTFLRQEAINNLERELYETLNKTKAYKEYLYGYKKSYLYPYIRRGKRIGTDFKMVDFRLPSDFPFVGKILYFEKSRLIEDRLEEVCNKSVSVIYKFSEQEIIEEFDEESIIPVLVTSSSFNSSVYKTEYYISASKGLFKEIAINQNRVGVEAKVKEHRLKENGGQVIILDYKGLELNLYRRDLENPKRTPPCGAILRVYPKRWDCSLRFNVDVSEKFQDSLKSFQFDTLPVVMTEEDGYSFIENVKEKNIDFENDEWKIGPVNEKDIPNVRKIKFQLGNQLVFTAAIENYEKPVFKFIEILDLSEGFSAEDIFVVMEAMLTLCTEEDQEEFDHKNYENLSNLSIMLFNEFKIQKALKTSHKGMSYFNKWAEINDKLINYLQKGKVTICEVENFSFSRIDKKSGLSVFRCNIINSDDIRKYIEEVSNGFHSEFFAEYEDGNYALVEFSEVGDFLYIYGNPKEFDESKLVKVFVKEFPYPEIQQKRALADFRSGRITNAKLQPYILDSSNIESSKGKDIVSSFYNENLAKNKPQRESVENAIAEQDIFMIQGPPGTGKTTVIREIIKQHIERYRNDRILIVSQANVAIDNVLKGMPKELYKGMIRCGKEEKIDEELKEISFENKYNKYIEKINSKSGTAINIGLTKWKELINKGNSKYNSVVGELLLKSHSIIGATCVGLAQKQIGLDRVEFDLVIIDEVGKALPAEILLPLNKAKKVILIGDHKQLPPAIHPALFDREKIEINDMEYCKDELFEKCLYENLYENCPKSNKSILKTQYRMPAVIGTMVSQFFYDNQLENGDITYFKNPIFFNKNINILDMSDVTDFKEIKEGNLPITNPKEAEVVYDVIKLIRSKVGRDKKIAVISPYRRQKSMITKYLNDKKVDIINENIAINTIDAFQGEEAEIVVYCTTRSTKKTDYFSDLARLNVAFSRAKNDLLIIGSLKYFKSYGEEHILNRIANYIEVNGDIIEYSYFQELEEVEKEASATSIDSIKEYKEFIIDIEKIVVPDDFKNTPTKRYKIEGFKAYFLANNKFDKPITLDVNFNVVNGYGRYVAARELGISSIIAVIEN